MKIKFNKLYPIHILDPRFENGKKWRLELEFHIGSGFGRGDGYDYSHITIDLIFFSITIEYDIQKTSHLSNEEFVKTKI